MVEQGLFEMIERRDEIFRRAGMGFQIKFIIGNENIVSPVLDMGRVRETRSYFGTRMEQM